MYDIGRVCLKTAGREAGKYCVIIKKIDEKFVMVTGPRDVTRVKRRRCNINHLEPLADVIKIKSDAPDEEVTRAMEKESVFAKLNIEKHLTKAEPERKGKAEKAKVPERKEGRRKEKKKRESKKPAESKGSRPKAAKKTAKTRKKK